MYRITKRTLGPKPERLMHVYPSEFAKRKSKKPFRTHNSGVGPDAEPRRINCAQCGAPIPDWANITKCWHCESDNFLGVVYPY